MLRALVTRAAVWVESIDQPTTLRLKASSTTQQKTLPSMVGCPVYVGHPELVGAVLGELAANKVGRHERSDRTSPARRRLGQALQACSRMIE
jgi:hypothetical protein